ncbi:hypothetical protein DSO57_1033924 [Entomophthora muscae]|uniref:Uncharacterized protein n=1 Tax=Entomophthora muscae TaxID=34485 RepID=A0ACC2S2C9_9FUNG|nr:hypothetical protein DSO57_1033924 [Entomophthora muscae]
MHHVIGLLWKKGPNIWIFVVGAAKCQFNASQFCSSSLILENENCVTSQCPEFYAEDALMLSQFHKKISEAALVVNHQFYVDLGVISITCSEINLAKDLYTRKCVKQVINQQKMGLVLLGYKKDSGPVWQKQGAYKALIKRVYEVLGEGFVFFLVTSNRGDVPWEATLVVVQHAGSLGRGRAASAGGGGVTKGGTVAGSAQITSTEYCAKSSFPLEIESLFL